MDPLSRRNFLKMSAVAGASLAAANALGTTSAAARDAKPGEGGEVVPGSEGAQLEDFTATTRSPMIYTAGGPIPPDVVKKVLAHEHLFVDFWGPTDEHYMKPLGGFDRAIEIIKPYVADVQSQGVNLIVDWGPVGVGRSVDTVWKIWRDTGVHIVIPTGIYKNLRPAEFAMASVEQLADFMLGEFMDGIEGTSVKPGFVKIAASPIPEPGEIGIHRAGARVAARTGASLCCHMPFPIDARDQTEIARARRVIEVALSEGVSLERFVWGHATGIVKSDGANLESSVAQHLELASQGVTIQYDAVGGDPAGGPEPYFNGPTAPKIFLDMMEKFVKLGYGDRVMVSNDASVYANPGGGPAGEDAQAFQAAGLPVWQYPRDIRYLYGTFETMLIDRVGEAAANQILRETPIRVFSR